MLNRAAAAVLASLPADAVHACTDITGFGLIGHATEMAAASGCSIEIELTSVPLLDGARDLVSRNSPGGARTNREHFGPGVQVLADADASLVDLLYRPADVGGLLIAVSSRAKPVTSAPWAAGVFPELAGTGIPSEGPGIIGG